MRTVKPAIKHQSVKIPVQDYYKIRELSEKTGRLLRDIMSDAIKEYLKKRKG
jgi:predicted DNA-binding protein